MISAETFYLEAAGRMLEPDPPGHPVRYRSHRIEGQPVAVWAAAVLAGERDDGRGTADRFQPRDDTTGLPLVDQAGDPVLLEAQPVRAQEGRWIVECPFCPSAQVAAETDRRFLCSDCLNRPVAGEYVRTEWPA